MCNMTVKRGDIFYADLSGSSWSEQGGIRPVLIIQNDVGNKFSPTTLVAPLTSKMKKCKLPTHIMIEADKCDGLIVDSIVMLEQIRTVDKNRLRNFVTHIDDNKIPDVERAIAVSFGFAERLSSSPVYAY